MRVLGIDCGSTSTGYGVIETDGRTCRVLDYGAICPGRRQTFAQRLKRIHQQVVRLLERFRPEAVALEEVFQALNVKSAMHLSQVRGVVLLAAARANLPVCEYSAATVKKSVVGYGGAEKHQVQQMVQRLLALPNPPEPPDAADALAVALCHIRHNESRLRKLAALKK
mgnify:CR=1 FL=1